MSTLEVVELILRKNKIPMAVRDIVGQAGNTLPTRSKTPDTVIARDLSMDIKKNGEDSHFIRTAPGRYTMREFVTQGIIQMGDSGNTPQPKILYTRKNATTILNKALSNARIGVKKSTGMLPVTEGKKNSSGY